MADMGIVETQYLTIAEPPHELKLDSGEKLGPITIAYETYGKLNAEATNAVLLTHALSGDAHVAGKHNTADRKPGWWDDMVGPGKAFDTDRYFVLCSNVLGGCTGSTGPGSVNPETSAPYGLSFPVLTIADMVRAQRELVRSLGISRLLSVAGGSMGGMQALEWATQFPDALQSAIVIASTPVSGAQQIAFEAVGRNAVQADPKFSDGHYDPEDGPVQGLAIARMLAHITYLSDASMREKFGRTLRRDADFRYDFSSEFSIETYLDYQGEQFVSRFDANTYLYVTKAMSYFDVTRRYGSLDAAMAEIQCKMLVLSYTSDWLYPPYQSEQIVYALERNGKNASYCKIESDYGHDAFLLEVDVMEKIIGGFLEHVPESADSTDERVRHEGVPSGGDQRQRHARRRMYDSIVGLVSEKSKVLDVGCGAGQLLSCLKREKRVIGVGIEKDQDRVVEAIQRGVSVIHADVDEGLEGFRDRSFDTVTLSMTLQVVERPQLALREMLRVGQKCILTFPNFGHWRVRKSVTLSGRSPVTENLPYSWYNTPNRHFFSIKDFRAFCRTENFHIELEAPMSGGKAVSYLPNLLAEDVLYVISNGA